jgi:membrane protease subunit HflC
MRIALCGAIVLLVGLVIWLSVFTVDPTEFVYVTQFGAHVATYDGGENDTDAGLHFRVPWPVQAVRRLDRRLQHFDLPAIELLTRTSAGGGQASGGVDKTLTVEAYVCWRIGDAKAVDRFIRKMDNADRAKMLLGQRVNSQLGAFIGQMRMDDLISTDLSTAQPNKEGGQGAARTKVDQTMEQLGAKLLGSLREDVLQEYGIQIVDLQLRRFNHPIKVRDTIFERIKSERESIAAEYRNEGKKRADFIRTTAQVKIDLLTKAAEKIEKEVKAEAELDAERIRAAAFLQDPNFFRFWQELDQMKSILGSAKTTLLLSTHRGVFDFLFHPPNGPSAPRSTDPGVKSASPIDRKDQ